MYHFIIVTQVHHKHSFFKGLWGSDLLFIYNRFAYDLFVYKLVNRLY